MKTIIAKDFLGDKKPNLIQRLVAGLQGGKIVFDQSQKQWCLKRRVTGMVGANRLFIPSPGQWVTYRIQL